MPKYNFFKFMKCTNRSRSALRLVKIAAAVQRYFAIIFTAVAPLYGQTELTWEAFGGDPPIDLEWNRTEDLGWIGTADNWGPNNLDGNYPNINTERAVFNTNSGSDDCLRTASDTIHSLIMDSDYSGKLSFGSFTMLIQRGGAADGDNADLRTGGGINYGTGKIKFHSSYGSNNTQSLWQNDGDTLPHIEHSGSDTLVFETDILCLSYIQTDGCLNLKGNNITTVGNFSVTKASGIPAFTNMEGCTISVDGSATFTGSSGDSIDMNASAAWYIDAATLNASYSIIGNSDARLGSVGNASESRNATPSTNYNWSFGATGKKRWDGGGAGNNWNTGDNWDPDGVPSIDDSVVFDNTSDDNCDLNVSATIQTILCFSTYNGELNYGSDTLTIIGGDADLRTGGNILPGSGALKLSGSGTQKLHARSSDTMPEILHSGSGILQLATNDLYTTGFTNSNGQIDFNGKDITVAGGDFTISNGTSTTIYGSPSSLGDRTITASGTITLNGESDDKLNLDPSSMCYFGATSGLVATYADLANCSASVITGVAASSTEGSNVYRWLFGDYIWSGGRASNDWDQEVGNYTNWEPSDPPYPGETGNEDVVVLFTSSSNRNCVMSISPTVEAIIFTAGYTGEFDFSGNNLEITDAVANFNGGGTFTGSGTITFSSSSTQDFTPKSSATFPAITHTGSGDLNVNDALTANAITQSSGGGTWNWGSNGKTHTVSSITATSGDMEFNNSTVKVSGNVSFSGLSSIEMGTGILQFTAANPATQTLAPVNGDTLPSVLHSGTGTLQLTTRLLACRSFTNNAGVLDFNGQDITTVSNFTINNGISSTISGTSLSGRTITVGGNAMFNGTSTDSLNLQAEDRWYVDASGNCAASYSVIDSSTASGTPGEATFCRDAGYNYNWDFDDEIDPEWHQSLASALSYGIMGDGAMYCARSTYIEKRNMSTGSASWSYNTTHTTTGLSYTWDSDNDEYIIVYSAGNYLGSVTDEGSGYNVEWGPTNIGSTVGIPYVDPDGTYFYVVYGNTLAKRNVSNGNVVDTYTFTNADTDVELVVTNNEIYAANESGVVKKFYPDGSAGLSRATGKKISNSLLVVQNTLYAAPDTNYIYAISTSTMSQKWQSELLAADITGEAFSHIGTNNKIFVSAGNYIYRLTDNDGSCTIDTDWPFDAGATVNSGPLLYSGVVYFGRTGGRYYALDNSDAGVLDEWPHMTILGDANLGPWIDQSSSPGQVIFTSTGGDFDAFAIP
jgi:hypothetical protein